MNEAIGPIEVGRAPEDVAAAATESYTRASDHRNYTMYKG